MIYLRLARHLNNTLPNFDGEGKKMFGYRSVIGTLSRLFHALRVNFHDVTCGMRQCFAMLLRLSSIVPFTVHLVFLVN